LDNIKETGPTGQAPDGKNPASNDLETLGDQIMTLLHERTANPSEAFVMLQQMCIFLWDQYKIDWKDHPDCKVADTRKQRYLDFVSGMVDNILERIKSE